MLEAVHEPEELNFGLREKPDVDLAFFFDQALLIEEDLKAEERGNEEGGESGKQRAVSAQNLSAAIGVSKRAEHAAAARIVVWQTGEAPHRLLEPDFFDLPHPFRLGGFVLQL